MAYATVADLADYMQADPPDNAQFLLERASEIVARLTMLALYDVDDEGAPIDAVNITAFKRATCAQAYFMKDATGPVAGTSAQRDVASASVGGVAVSYRDSVSSTVDVGLGGSLVGQVSPHTISILRVAGLIRTNPLRW